MSKTQSGPKPRRDLQGYIDETGLLHTTDRLFGMGLLLSTNINHLHRRLVNYKNSVRFHQEFKFTGIRNKNVTYYKGLVDTFFSVPNSVFSCYIYDKKNMDIQKYFKGNHEKAYNSYCGRLIATTMLLMGDKFTDYVTILADDVSTSKADHFEREVRAKVRQVTRRNAISNIIRLESHAVTEIQLVDVFLGSVAYAYKIDKGVITTPNKAKLQVIKHIQKKIRVPMLAQDIDRRVKSGVRFKVKEIVFK